MAENVKKIYVQVAVSLPIKGTFTYTVSGDNRAMVTVGKRVLVPFSGRKVTGYILRLIQPEERKGLKNIITVIDPYPLFPETMVAFFEWLSRYYRYPIGLVIKTALPAGLNVRIPNGKQIPLQGWLDRVGISKKTFVTLKKSFPTDESFLTPKRAPRNEEAFLELMATTREISLSEIKTTFSNSNRTIGFCWSGNSHMLSCTNSYRI